MYNYKTVGFLSHAEIAYLKMLAPHLDWIPGRLGAGYAKADLLPLAPTGRTINAMRDLAALIQRGLDKLDYLGHGYDD